MTEQEYIDVMNLAYLKTAIGSLDKVIFQGGSRTERLAIAMQNVSRLIHELQRDVIIEPEPKPEHRGMTRG